MSTMKSLKASDPESVSASVPPTRRADAARRSAPQIAPTPEIDRSEAPASFLAEDGAIRYQEAIRAGRLARSRALHAALRRLR